MATIPELNRCEWQALKIGDRLFVDGIEFTKADRVFAVDASGRIEAFGPWTEVLAGEQTKPKKQKGLQFDG